MADEYIERNAVVAFLENMAASRYLIQCFGDKEKFPAADVTPVVHGKWVPIVNYFHGKPDMSVIVLVAERVWTEVIKKKWVFI